MRAQITIHRRDPIGKPPPLENFSSLSQYIGNNGFALGSPPLNQRKLIDNYKIIQVQSAIVRCDIS